MNRNLMKPMALLGTLILILSLMIRCSRNRGDSSSYGNSRHDLR